MWNELPDFTANEKEFREARQQKCMQSKLIFYKDEVLKNKFKNICRIKGLGL